MNTARTVLHRTPDPDPITTGYTEDGTVYENDCVILLDRSGSMSGEEKKTIEGVNGFLATLRGDPLAHNTRISLMIWDHAGFDFIRRGKASEIKDITLEEYKPRGATPLYDSTHFGMMKLSGTKRNLVVILTDGEENSSTKWNKDSLKKVIEDRLAAGWRFVYLGANFDAWKAAADIGIPKETTMNFSQQAESVPAQPGQPNVFQRFGAHVAQNPVAYALGATALLATAFFATRGNAETPGDGFTTGGGVFGFTDLDRNASMGVTGAGNDTWQNAVTAEAESFVESVPSASLFHQLPEHTSELSALGSNFDPTQGSLVDGVQAGDFDGDILSSAGNPLSGDFEDPHGIFANNQTDEENTNLGNNSDEEKDPQGDEVDSDDDGDDSGGSSFFGSIADAVSGVAETVSDIGGSIADTVSDSDFGGGGSDD